MHSTSALFEEYRGLFGLRSPFRERGWLRRDGAGSALIGQSMRVCHEFGSNTYLRSKDRAFCSLCEKPFGCSFTPTAFCDENSSADSDRFLFPEAGAAEGMLKSFCAGIESPLRVVIAEGALMGVGPALDLNASVSYSTRQRQLK